MNAKQMQARVIIRVNLIFSRNGPPQPYLVKINNCKVFILSSPLSWEPKFSYSIGLSERYLGTALF